MENSRLASSGLGAAKIIRRIIRMIDTSGWLTSAIKTDSPARAYSEPNLFQSIVAGLRPRAGKVEGNCREALCISLALSCYLLGSQISIAALNARRADARQKSVGGKS